MTITHNNSHLEKFHIDFPNNIKAPLNKRVESGFKLIEKEYNKEYVFLLEFNYYQTNIDTDYMLDANVNTVVAFKTETSIPTVAELYDIYLKVNRQANGLMLNAARDKYNLTWDISFKENSLEEIESQLKKSIEDVLTD
jgi:hypothetical protein